MSSSEYVGSAFVKILPDTTGFASTLDREISQRSTGTQGILQRTGLGDQLKDLRKTGQETTQVYTQIAQAEGKAEESARKLGEEHEHLSVHAHRASIAGFGVRASTVAAGAGALIAAEGLRELGNELKVTGAQADTLTGSLRNAAAAALTGNFAEVAKQVGQALAAGVNPAATNEASAALAHESQVNRAVETARTILDLREKLAKAEGQVGTAAGVTRYQLERQLKIAQDTFNAFGSRTRRTAAGQFDLAPDLGNKVALAPTDASRQSDFGLQSLRAAQTKQLADDRKLFEDRQDFLKKQIAYLENAGAKTQAAKDRLSTLYGQLDSVEGQLQSLDEQAAQKRQARLQARLASDQTNLQIQAANARTDAQEAAAIQADAAFARTSAQNKNLDAQTRLGYQLQAAQDDKTLYENAKAAAEKAAADAKAAAAAIKAAREEAARKAQELLDQQRQAYRDNISLEEQKLGLNVQRAQLTDKSLADDRKAIKAQIAFYQAQAKDFKLTDSERLNFRSQAVSAQLSLKSLNNSSNNAPRSSASDFFKEAASQFRTQGSNISTAGGILSGQDTRAAFAARALGSGNIAQTMAQQAQQTRNASLVEAQKQTALLTTIAGRLTFRGARADPPAKGIDKARRGAHVVQSAT